MFNKILNFGADSIRKVAGIALTPQDVKAKYDHEIRMAMVKQFSEYMTSEPTTIVGRIIKSLNALVRPACAYSVIALLAIAVIDPNRYTAAMIALQGSPQEVFIWAGGIATFYFGSRLQTKGYDHKERLSRLENLDNTQKLLAKVTKEMTTAEVSRNSTK